MLELDDPANVVCRASMPILAPRDDHERMRDIPNVAYSCEGIMGNCERMDWTVSIAGLHGRELEGVGDGTDATGGNGSQ